MILALLFACRTSLGFQFQTIGSVSNQLAAQLGFSVIQIGTLIGLFMLPGAFLALPSGFAGRWASDRALVAAGLMAMGLGSGIAALADGFGGLALGRLACGVGFVVSTIYFTKMVADWFVGKELATAMGILVMSWPFGIAMGQIGHEWMAGHLGYRVPFAVAAVYSVASALCVWLFYRPHESHAHPAAPVESRLPRRELILTLIASAAWAFFNAGYIVYLSFAPRVLQGAGYPSLQAAAIVSLASWVMIFSGAAAGQVADRTRQPDRVLYLCLAAGIAALLLLPHGAWAVALSLVFGLLGAAPAGVVMALTGQSMSPQRRAFGMGVFQTTFFVLLAPAPAVAGWIHDRAGGPYPAIVFAASLFGLTALANAAFRVAQSRGTAR
ncbi:MAG: MFS transporter [Burkholderiaceae bacterium]